MAPHSSTLAWKIPWMEEPGRLRSMELLRVGHDWATSLSLFTFMHWRRKWQPTPVLLPGESQGWGSLVGCRLRGRTELDTTEVTFQHQQCIRQPVDLLISDIWNWCLDFAPFILLSLGFFVCLFPFFSSIELMKNSFFPFSSLTSLGVVRFFCSFSDYFTIFNMYT